MEYIQREWLRSSLNCRAGTKKSHGEKFCHVIKSRPSRTRSASYHYFLSAAMMKKSMRRREMSSKRSVSLEGMRGRNAFVLYSWLDLEDDMGCDLCSRNLSHLWYAKQNCRQFRWKYCGKVIVVTITREYTWIIIEVPKEYACETRFVFIFSLSFRVCNFTIEM